MKKIIILLTTFLFLFSCSKIKTMNQEIANIVDVQSLLSNDIKEDISAYQQIKGDFFYSNGSLYIADHKGNRILAVDEDNKIFLEIGNLRQKTQDQSEKFWAKELQDFILQHHKEGEEETSLKERTLRTTPRKKARVSYAFDQVDKVVADLEENLYVSNYSVQGMSLLKFDHEGKFLYFIGEEGRDNQFFSGDAKIISLSVSKENGLWIKYYDKGMIKIRYYNSYGKNTLLFEEKEIEEGMNAFLEKSDNEFYRIEDIFAMPHSQKIAVIINVYKKEEKRFRIARKMFFEVNRHYNVENFWKFSETSLQVFAINSQNHILCFSYLPKERQPLLITYDIHGDAFLEKKITLQKFNYHRTALLLTQQGELMGAFLKKNLLYFVLWR